MSEAEKCDKCDGPHATASCPYFSSERFNDAATRASSARAATETKRKFVDEDAKKTEPVLQDDGSAYLCSLSRVQRDKVLESITYVDLPVLYSVSADDMCPPESLLNYSQLFAEVDTDLTSKFKLPKPSGLFLLLHHHHVARVVNNHHFHIIFC